VGTTRKRTLSPSATNAIERFTADGGEGMESMINRRVFVSLLAVAPPICKALVMNNAEWDQFAHELSRALRSLQAGHYLIIEMKGDPYYVQFAAGGSLGMRAEAVSNGHLDSEKLSDKACARLLQLGWNAPTIMPDRINDVRGSKGRGSPNFFLDIEVPVPYSSVANLAVNTLRQVFLATHPGQLRYTAFAKQGGSIEFPSLRIARMTPDGPSILPGGAEEPL